MTSAHLCGIQFKQRTKGLGVAYIATINVLSTNPHCILSSTRGSHCHSQFHNLAHSMIFASTNICLKAMSTWRWYQLVKVYLSRVQISMWLHMFFRLYLPWQVGAQQPAIIDPNLDLCTRYPLRLCGPRQCGILRLPNISTYGQHWESNPRPYDLESNALSTWPHAPNS